MSTPFVAVRTDPSFPERLRCVPRLEYLEAEGPLSGALDRLSHAVAIVGTRKAPPAALRYTRWFASQLARVGVVIVSGGARGIDAAAHQGALDVGGRTIAVLPAGIDHIYPEEHAELFARIAASGALVAIHPRGTPIRSWSFDLRNAAISALSDHVVMTCAPLKSGARSTAKHAKLQETPLWVVPGAPWDVVTEGCASECVRQGARPLINPNAILAALNLESRVEGSFFRTGPDGERVEPAFGPQAPQSIEQLIGSGDPRRGVRLPRQIERRPRSVSNRVEAASIPPAFPPPSDETRESILPFDDERNVLEALRQGPLGIDELVLRTGLGVGSLRGLLLTWTVEGVVREGPAGLFRLATH